MRLMGISLCYALCSTKLCHRNCSEAAGSDGPGKPAASTGRPFQGKPTMPTWPTGDKVRGSRSGRPVMALLDLLGRRWSLRILWELRHHRLSSRALRMACDDASPSVLQRRLGELRAAHLLDHVAGEGYGLTTAGRELEAAFAPLYHFANRWAGAAKRPSIERARASRAQQ